MIGHAYFHDIEQMTFHGETLWYGMTMTILLLQERYIRLIMSPGYLSKLHSSNNMYLE